MTNTTNTTETETCQLCDGQHPMNECPSHACTGDNCYCIGGDENLDAAWDDSIMESLKA